MLRAAVVSLEKREADMRKGLVANCQDIVTRAGCARKKDDRQVRGAFCEGIGVFTSLLTDMHGKILSPPILNNTQQSKTRSKRLTNL